MDHSFEVKRSADRATVFVTGEIDLETSPSLRRGLLDLAGEVQTVVVDCAGLEFIDSTGLAALLTAHKATQEAGGSFEIASAPAMLVKMIRIVGLEDVLVLTSD